jgi:hypothetical protein
MSNLNAVDSNNQLFFSRVLVAGGFVQLSATGNAVANLALMFGGLTNSGNSSTSGRVIVRQITALNASGTTPQNANIAILTSTDGNYANAVTANTVLTNLTDGTKYQDVTFTGTANTVVSGNTTQAFSVLVNTAGGAGSQCEIRVYADVVSG